MIPVLAVPVLDRYDLLSQMEASVDAEVKRYYVIDNGGKYDTGMREPSWAEQRHVCNPGGNLGFGASVNLTIKANIHAPWWMFANDDMVFAPGDLAAFEEAMWGAAMTPTVGTMHACGYSAFAINERAVEAVGWFDESYHPAYCEDCDMDWRCARLGVARLDVPGTSRHKGSQTIGGSQARRARNDFSYPHNVKYHEAKWGGAPWSEVFETPFNKGGDPSVTTAPKLSRLRDLAW